MNDSLPQLVTALREELQQYGEMLALLDSQQDLVVRRVADELLGNVAAINAQTAVIQLARRERGQRQSGAARALGLDEDAAIAALVAVLPEPQAVLIQALVNENNQCLQRVRRRVSQNHLLLARSVDLMQQLLATLMEITQTTVYQGDGKIATSVSAARPLFDTVG
jgi:flagellar biosynthesis/type III secretory pathway chaperone